MKKQKGVYVMRSQFLTVTESMSSRMEGSASWFTRLSE